MSTENDLGRDCGLNRRRMTCIGDAIEVFPYPPAAGTYPEYGVSVWNTQICPGETSGHEYMLTFCARLSNVAANYGASTNTRLGGDAGDKTVPINLAILDQLEKIKICKVTSPTGVTTPFEFTGLGSSLISLTDGTCSETYNFQVPDGSTALSVPITELDALGWATNYAISGTYSSTGTGKIATVNLRPDDDVTVTFTNTRMSCNPRITCPTDITACSETGLCTKTLTEAYIGSPTIAGDCTGVDIVTSWARSDGVTSLTAPFSVGKTTITWTATPAVGTPASCTQTITINDCENPTITCPDAIKQDADEDLCSATVTVTAPTGADNCGVSSVVGVRSDLADLAAPYPVGTTTITWTVTDTNGLTAKCTQDVVIAAVCDDGAWCNGAETCDAELKCQAGTAPVVDDDIACTDDFCDETTDKVVHTPVDSRCSDRNVCTDDSCNPTSGCVNAANTASCNDNNACTQTDTCTEEVCGGSNPVVCQALDQCHDVGTCEPSTGVCSDPAKADGTTCNDENACTQTDTCTAGVCGGSNPVVCQALDQCHDVGTCEPSTGVCSDPAKADGTTCNDENACTQTDTCTAGVCGGSNPVVCQALDQCHDVGTCEPSTGVCSDPAKADGTTCDDENACTQTDTCTAGVCGGSNPVVCQALDQCHDVGTCEPSTGVCSDPAKADGTTCDDENACTQTDTCTAGVCGGSNPVVCQALDQCHDVGTCEPSTGVCSDPAKADGTTCDDENACTEGDVCAGGSCTPGTDVTCSDGDACNGVETCDAELGCQAGIAPNCDDSNECIADSCDPATGACVYTPIVCTPPNRCYTSACFDGACVDTARPNIPTRTLCGDVCTNLNTDRDNCGKCGHSCPSGYICTKSVTCGGKACCIPKPK